MRQPTTDGAPKAGAQRGSGVKLLLGVMVALELLVLVALATSGGGSTDNRQSALTLRPAATTSVGGVDGQGGQQELPPGVLTAPMPGDGEPSDQASALEAATETPAAATATPASAQRAEATEEAGEEAATPQPSPTEETSQEITEAAPTDDAAARLLQLINAERTTRGLAALTVNAALTRAAANQCLYIATNQVTGPDAHLGPDGSNHIQRAQAEGYPSVYVVEDLAWGHVTPEAVVAAWLNSPDHRKNLLDANIRDAGVAHCTVSEGDYRDWWVFIAGALL